MVLTFDQESELEILKHQNKMSFEAFRHQHKMDELDKETEYARIIGGDLNERDTNRDD